MKIITYAASLADEAPEHLRCCARMIVDGKLSPIIVHAATKSEARERLQTWWDGEMERGRKRREAAERRTEAMRRDREARRNPHQETQP